MKMPIVKAEKSKAVAIISWFASAAVLWLLCSIASAQQTPPMLGIIRADRTPTNTLIPSPNLPTPSPAPVYGYGGPLTYHGGAIMPTANIAAFFWGSGWQSYMNTGSDVFSGIDNFYSGFSSSSYAEASDEYTDKYNRQVGPATRYMGENVDYSSSGNGDDPSAMLNYVCSVIANPSTSRFADPSGDGYYAVYLDKPRDSQSPGCAYHSFGTCNGSGIHVQYGVFYNLDNDLDCTPTFTNTGLHSQLLGSLANSSAHELSEARTDPNGDGWLDENGNENGDKCVSGGTLGTTFDVPLITFPDPNGTQWKIQGEWSNNAYNYGIGQANRFGQPGCFWGFPAFGQNQWLTAFWDTSYVSNSGQHIYYEGSVDDEVHQIWGNNAYGAFGGTDINMNLLTGTSNSPDAPAFGTLASFESVRGQQTYQHVYYVDSSGHIRHLFQNMQCNPIWGCTSSTGSPEDLTLLTGSPLTARWKRSLTGFGNARGEHLYYTGADNHVHHLFWSGTESIEDLTGMAQPNPDCAVPKSGLTSASDGSTELVYYVGPSGHICELAWYSTRIILPWGVFLLWREGSWDLTAMSGSHLAMLYSPLTGFSDTNGQSVFYLGTNRHIYWLNLARSGGWKNQDLTAGSGDMPAVNDSLTSLSNAYGEQVFYVDIYAHVHQIGLTGFNNDLTALLGLPCPGILHNHDFHCLPYPDSPTVTSGGCGWGTSLTSTPEGASLFYMGADQHVYEFQLYPNPYTYGYKVVDVTSSVGGIAAGGCAPGINGFWSY